MRMAVGSSLIALAIETIIAGAEGPSAVLHVLGAVAGILLLVGFWTPIAGALVALGAAWQAFMAASNTGFYMLLSALAAALVLLGPGAWSIDARLFGWKRIEIPDRDDHDPPLS